MNTENLKIGLIAAAKAYWKYVAAFLVGLLFGAVIG